jgi:hypothetical protein
MFGFIRLIDQKTFHEIIGDDMGHLDTIIALFDEQANDNMSNMHEALLKNDALAFERAAHDLKNLGRNIAAQKLIEHSHELERLAAESALEAAAKRLKETSDLLARASRELKKLRKKWG